MTKQEQIEEVAKIINRRCEAELGQVHANSKNGKVTKTVGTSLIAKDIINAGYRKTPKDKLVISEKEYEQLKTPSDCAICEYKEIKDAAKEIFLKLIEVSENFNGAVPIGVLKVWAIEYGIEVK